MTALRVGIAGLGTVGGGVVKLLAEHADLHAARAGRGLRLAAASALEMPRALAPLLKNAVWHGDALDLAASPEVDVVVELIGGEEGIARKVVEKALQSGKSVVTANKALIAHHGNELAKAAEDNGASLLFEAAVAGGVPILKAMREGLAANRFVRVYGILNGTCNYILTEMEQTGRDFDEVLAEAQARGYAEANPSTDVDGFDAAHKLAILTAVAFGCPVNFSAVFVEGIRAVSALDIEFARELGYRIKLLGITGRGKAGIEQRVHPCMVWADTPIAQVSGVLNAVVAEGDFVGQTVFEGAGAGERPTASAVVGDLIDLARGRAAPPFAVPVSELVALPAQSMADRTGAYYVRLIVRDQPGVLADAAEVFAAAGVSIESVLQRGRDPKATVPLILTTHATTEAAMRRVRTALAGLAAVVEEPMLIRIESL
ncbi:MAG: homoserine dehydrogenase [Proteobacteria bacterium]|nr:homoserine dehydrogenase [Pseudomonadota bacterium]